MLHRLILALGLLAALGACDSGGGIPNPLEGALGGKYDYAALELPLTVAPAHSVAVTVIDHRPYVVNGKEPPKFVGTMAGRYRNTVDVATSSGLPLAELMTDAIARALERQGADVTGVKLRDGTGDAAALTALGATGADRLLVVRLREWQTNATVRVTAHWHLEAAVYDRAGRLLGQRAVQGTQPIGVESLDEEAGAHAVAALSRRLALLLGDPAITAPLGPA